MNGDIYFPSGDGWNLDQLFDFFPSDDVDMTRAHDGLPGISIKSETLAVTPVGLEALCSSPTEGSLGLEWMEQDFDFNYASILSLDDNLPCKSPSSSLLPTTTTASFSISPVAELKELESAHPEFADKFLHTLQTESSLKPEIPFSPSSYQDKTPEVHVTPEIVLDADHADTPALQVLEGGKVEFLQCPLSPDDVESLLSSASSLATSPDPTPSPAPSSPATADTSILNSDNGSWSFNSSDLYKVVENTDKSRPTTPYSRTAKSSKGGKSKGRKQTASISPTPTELELELMSKKDRKKLQNKNAAIRYRMKKKQESEVKKTEVEELEDVNRSLLEKCDELQREVKCMKDLINEIRKARGQPPLSL